MFVYLQCKTNDMKISMQFIKNFNAYYGDGLNSYSDREIVDMYIKCKELYSKYWEQSTEAGKKACDWKKELRAQKNMKMIVSFRTRYVREQMDNRGAWDLLAEVKNKTLGVEVL
jgi:hypothetical protein